MLFAYLPLVSSQPQGTTERQSLHKTYFYLYCSRGDYGWLVGPRALGCVPRHGRHGLTGSHGRSTSQPGIQSRVSNARAVTVRPGPLATPVGAYRPPWPCPRTIHAFGGEDGDSLGDSLAFMQPPNSTPGWSTTAGPPTHVQYRAGLSVRETPWIPDVVVWVRLAALGRRKKNKGSSTTTDAYRSPARQSRTKRRRGTWRRIRPGPRVGSCQEYYNSSIGLWSLRAGRGKPTAARHHHAI